MSRTGSNHESGTGSNHESNRVEIMKIEQGVHESNRSRIMSQGRTGSNRVES